MNYSKSDRYLDLIARFKKHVFSDPELVNPHFIDGFNYDVVNPWELWHNNLDANIMFIGQDFSDTVSLKKNLEHSWAKEKNGKTNLLVTDFFSVLGSKYYFDGVDYTSNKSKHPLFFTNAILGIKKSELDINHNEKESMSKSVKESWYKETMEYLKELIDIIQPQYIIAMGKISYKAVCAIYGIKPKEKIFDAIGEEIILPDGKRLFVVQHCSKLGQRTRTLNQQFNDWMDIRNIIDPV